MENEDLVFAGWIAIYNGKRIEIRLGETDTLWGAEQIAIKRLRVPKSKRGLLTVAPGYE